MNNTLRIVSDDHIAERKELLADYKINYDENSESMNSLLLSLNVTEFPSSRNSVRINFLVKKASPESSLEEILGRLGMQVGR